MKIALIQMKVVKDNDENILKALEEIKKAAADKVDMAILPEMFSCPYETVNFPLYAQPQSGKNVSMLANAAKENKIYVVAGSMPESEADKTYNTSYVFNPKGEIIAKHRKMHLFDIDIKNGQYFKESETLSAGDEITLFDTEFGTMGLAICFDLRFSEMSRIMALNGAKIIIVPAVFNMTTGPMHWELLFKARAVDNQVFTIGVACARDYDSSYISYAHSIVVSPWGEIIEKLGEKEEMRYCKLDLSQVENARQELPILSARREDIYRVETIR